jgi:hypothetical protein
MLKRPQTEPFHDTAARILPAERDDTLPARLTVIDEPLKLTKNFSKLGLGCSAKCEIVGITLSRSWGRKHSLAISGYIRWLGEDRHMVTMCLVDRQSDCFRLCP